MKCSNFLLKINSLLQVSMVLKWAISASINCYRTHEIEDRSVFLNISKAFDKMWHDRIIFKRAQNVIWGNLFNILRDFLNERKQLVILNGQFSTWKNFSAEIPQGSIICPLLFLIYINDLTEGILSNAKLFADEKSLVSVIYNIQTCKQF